MKSHWSSCSLHRLPARLPQKCDCGGFEGGGRWWEDFYQLWQYRWHWKQETNATWADFISKTNERKMK